MKLEGKHIVLGVTGSIAAYKSASLIRLLVKEGAEVKVVMTKLAKEFITPLTLATLSKNTIAVEFFNPENGQWNSHVSIGLWADLFVIAPATANTISKMANGVADNLLITSYLSAKCPIIVAPAMDLDMYRHPSIQKNIKTLISYGNIIVEPDSGELASGLIGKGRMAEPIEIVDEIIRYTKEDKDDFRGKKVLISAGPTYEKIDPVRFIGNYSSGKMGFALANEFSSRGAEVFLVAGPVNLKTPSKKIQRTNVESAKQMYNAMVTQSAMADIVISCAAVADFTPEFTANKKMKRGHDELVVRLKPTNDIAKELGRIKHDGQILVGFALETNDEESNAKLKLEKKNLDLIVLNSLNDKNTCFGYDTNKITILSRSGKIFSYSLKEKAEVAKDIVDKIKKI